MRNRTASAECDSPPVRAGIDAVKKYFSSKRPRGDDMYMFEVTRETIAFDTTRALYLWEWPNYPQYVIPRDDADRWARGEGVPPVNQREERQCRLRGWYACGWTRVCLG